MGIEFKPIAGALGAEVEGIDLTQALSKEQIQHIKRGLLKHLVLFFRDQNIEAKQHKNLALCFGTPQPHPAYPSLEGYPETSILINDKDRPSKIDTWHTDMTFMEKPPMGSILKAIEVPEYGSDTLWANMYKAYDELSERMKRYLDGLVAVHDFAHGFQESLSEPGGRERLKQALLDNPPVQHPVIRIHPETGKKALFVNALFTTRIVGLNKRESKSILEYLYEHAVQPEYTCRLRWQANTIAFWDNRATQHKPILDYHPAYREMVRITIAGERPV